MKLKKLNTKGFSHDIVIVLFVIIFAIAGVGYLVASHATTPAPVFTYLANHPQSSLQPTYHGRIIYALTAFNGKLYSGYGDYGANTGPIAITPFDPSSNTFASTPELQPCADIIYPIPNAYTNCDQTEAIGLYRVLNGKLYAPSSDPRENTSTDYAVGTVLNGSVSWQQVGPQWPAPDNGVGMTHSFDMNTIPGTGDLWMVGSQGDDAVAYRSLDGGKTWTKSLDVTPPTGNYERFYAAGVYNGKLYVQAMIINSATNAAVAAESNSHVFSGTAWAKGPSLAGGSLNWWKPDVFAGKMVYLSGWAAPDGPGLNVLESFNGSNVQPVGPGGELFTDYTIDGNTLYALNRNQVVYSTTDLVNWYQQSTAPSAARSIAVLNNKIYVGTAGTLSDTPLTACSGSTCPSIYSAPVNTSPTPVSSSTSGSTSGKTPGGGKGHVPKP
jgi:hypothetical protein